MFCSNCGNEIKIKANYCPKCGYSIEEDLHNVLRYNKANFKIVDGVRDQIDSALKRVSNPEESFKEYLKKQKDKNPDYNHLTLVFDVIDTGYIFVREKAQYSFFDSEYNQICYAYGKDNRRKQHIVVFSKLTGKIGEIIEKPKFMGLGDSNYVIKTISGSYISMNSKRNLFGDKYEITPYGWIFKKVGLGKFEITDSSENMIMRFAHRPLSFGQVLHIEFKDKKTEVVAALLGLSIYANYLSRGRYLNRSTYAE